MPQAFVRRCVTLSLTRPGDEMLREIAAEHNEGLTVGDGLLDDVVGGDFICRTEITGQGKR